MKILCFGAGAIGSYIAGSLALIGNPLVYVEQPRFIDQLKANGVRIEDINGEKHHLKLFDAYGSAEEAFAVHDFDLVITAVKGFNTDDVISALKPFADRVPAILSYPIKHLRLRSPSQIITRPAATAAASTQAHTGTSFTLKQRTLIHIRLIASFFSPSK